MKLKELQNALEKLSLDNTDKNESEVLISDYDRNLYGLANVEIDEDGDIILFMD